MEGSVEAGGAVNGVAVTAFRRAMRRVRLSRARTAGRTALTIAELALTQMGVPGAVACCEYFFGWWGGAGRPSGRVVSDAAAVVRDHERN